MIGSRGILGSTSSSKIHSATAGETVVGFMQGNFNLLISGFWHQGSILNEVDEEAEARPPKIFALHQIYPNPFKPQTAYSMICLLNAGGFALKFSMSPVRACNY